MKLRTIGVCGALGIAAFASSPDGGDQEPRGGGSSGFEVASVKPAPRAAQPKRFSVRIDSQQVRYVGVTLGYLLTTAYGVREYQISGPAWVDRETYDISATLLPNTSTSQVPEMLRHLLSDRFKLALHHESRALPVYALTETQVRRAALRPAGQEEPINSWVSPEGHVLVGKGTMGALAIALSRILEYPVVDRTTIDGVYDFSLSWVSPEGMRDPKAGVNAAPAPESSAAASIFTALRATLGLKLEFQRLPTDILVIDHVERVPTEN